MSVSVKWNWILDTELESYVMWLNLNFFYSKTVFQFKDSNFNNTFSNHVIQIKISSSIIYSLRVTGVSCSLSQLPLGEGRAIPWISRQTTMRTHIHTFLDYLDDIISLSCMFLDCSRRSDFNFFFYFNTLPFKYFGNNFFCCTESVPYRTYRTVTCV